MITCYQFAPGFGIPNPSPFCMKLEGFLRLTGLPHRLEIMNDPRKAPKKKLPYIEDKGKIIADSTLVIDYLKSTYQVNPDSHLSVQELAVQRAMILMLEDHFYWTLMYSRWWDDAFWPATRDTLFANIPSLIRPMITSMIRNKVKEDMTAQGLCRHSAAEICDMGAKDLQALSHYLADKTWFGGDKPSLLDVVAVSFTANVLKPPMATPLKKAAASHENLVQHCERALKTIFVANSSC